jgi:hypothetical protein
MKAQFALALAAVLPVIPMTGWAQPELAARTSFSAGETRLDGVMRLVAWPGYGMAAKDGSQLGHAEKGALAGERISFLVDVSTTLNSLSNNCYETNAMNTLFGKRNRPGVALSMTVWELGLSYASGAIPRRLGRGRMAALTRAAVVVGGGILTRERINVSIYNHKNAE